MSHLPPSASPAIAFDASAGWLLHSMMELRGHQAGDSVAISALVEALRQGLRFVSSEGSLLIGGLEPGAVIAKHRPQRAITLFDAPHAAGDPATMAAQLIVSGWHPLRSLVSVPEDAKGVILFWRCGPRRRYQLLREGAWIDKSGQMQEGCVAGGIETATGHTRREEAIERLAGLCLAMACENVGVVHVHASRRENTLRRRKGLAPCPSYAALAMKMGDPSMAVEAGHPLPANAVGPGMLERREPAGMYWINPAGGAIPQTVWVPEAER